MAGSRRGRQRGRCLSPALCSGGGSAALARSTTGPGERVRAGTGVAQVLAVAGLDKGLGLIIAVLPAAGPWLAWLS